MALKVGFVQGTMPATATTQDLTPAVTTAFSSDIAGALVWMGSPNGYHSNTNDFRFSIGAYDGTTQGCVALYGQNFTSLSNSNWRRNANSTNVIGETADSSSFNSLAAASFNSDGLRLTWSAVSGQKVVNALLIGGSGVTAKVLNFDFATSTSEVSLAHGLGAAPTFLIAFSHNQSAAGTSSRGSLSLGMWATGGTYRCHTLDRLDNQANEAVVAELLTTALISENGASAYSITVTTANSTNVGLTASSTNVSTDRVTVLAVYVPSGWASVGTLTHLTSTGDSTITGLSGTPAAILTLPTKKTATGSGNTDADGLFGLGCASNDATTIDQGGLFCVSDDNATTPTNKSQASSSQVIRNLSTSGSATGNTTGAVTSWASDGLTVNFATVSGNAELTAYLAFGENGAAPEPTAVESITDPMVDGSTVTMVWDSTASAVTGVTVGGVAVTLSTNTSSGGTFTLSLGDRRYGPNDVVVTNAAGLTTTLEGIQLDPPATKVYVDLSNSLVGTSNRQETSATDLVGGEQAEYSNPVNATLANCYVDPSGWLACDPTNPAIACSFDVRYHDGIVWGTSATVTFAVTTATAPSVIRRRDGRRGRSSARTLNIGRG